MQAPSRFEAVFAAAGDAMLVAGDDRRYVDVNAAACALVGLSRAQVLGRRIDDFSELAATDIDRVWRDFLATGQMAGDFWIRRADGERRLVEFHATANIVPGEHLSVLRDVTEARRVGDELLARERAARASAEQSEARFRFLAEELPQFVFIAAPDGSFEYVNDRVVHYTGMDLPSIKQGRWIDAIHPEDSASVMERWKETLANGTPLEMEYRLRNRAGQYRWFLVRAVAHRDRSGAIAQLVGASTDIDDQKRQQRELESAAEFREQLLGIVGHDLRNPLASIVYAAAALLKRGSLNEADARTVERVATSAERMSHIVDQTLDFTRSRLGGGISISVGDADLASICRQAIDEMEVAHPGVEFHLSTDGNARGRWDAQRLSQVLSNLLGNAVQHGDAGRPVRVQVRGGADDAVELIVRNDGPPIPPALLPVIFEAFRHGARQQQSNGSLGLGLFIVRQIALAHGGDVTAHSSPSEGTSFVVRLPRGARAM